ATLQGWTGPGLLDSYGAERQPVFASTARDFIEQSILIDRDFLRRHDPARDRADFEAAWEERRSGARAEVNAFEPHYEGSPIVFGPPGSACSAIGGHAFAARAGHHLAPQPLSAGGYVFERLGRGFTLIALGAGEAADAFAAAAKELGVPLEIINDTAAQGREKYQARLILVRPDQFVAWAADRLSAPAEPARVLRRAIGHLDSGAAPRAATT
ncbi:MAG: monooxygenase, partial [Bradyrhizobium sp.]|nr:monooxygenase [Bradyrhizobium sp.]